MSAAASSTCRPASRSGCAASIGLVMPDREALLRAARNGEASRSTGTKFAFKEHNDHVEATCPWGNTFRLSRAGGALRPAWSSACPMSSSTCRSARPRASPASTRKIFGALTERRRGRAMRRRRASRSATAGAGLPRDRRRRSRPMTATTSRSMSRNFSGPHRRLLEREPRHRGEQPVPVSLRDHHRSRQRQAAVPDRARDPQHDATRSMRGRWSTAIPRRPTGTTWPGRDAWVPDAMVEEMDNPRDERRQSRIEAVARRVAAE